MKKIIAGISALAMVAMVGVQAASATEWFPGDRANEIKITNKNYTNVATVQLVSADSGNNEANGTAKGSQPRRWFWDKKGGDDYGHGYGNGSAAMGGSIESGPVAAEGTVLAELGSNDVRLGIASCGCDEGTVGGDLWNKFDIYNKNTTNVFTIQAISANSGNNQANGKAKGSNGKLEAAGGDITTGSAQAVGNVGTVAGTNTVVIEVIQ